MLSGYGTADSADPVLSVTGLGLAYGDAIALTEASLTVLPGATTTVLGANGAGKTSLIRAIAGILTPRCGRVRFQGEDITGLPSHKICERGIGHVAEGRQIFGGLSVRENLDLGASLKRARRHRHDSLAYVLDLFPRLHERLTQTAGTLSGGEQQMLAIGRCLMARPSLILLDEPSQGLAPTLVRDLFAILARLKARNMPLVLVEQNVQASLALADHGYVLENGRVVLAGSAADLTDNMEIRRAYLGL